MLYCLICCLRGARKNNIKEKAGSGWSMELLKLLYFIQGNLRRGRLMPAAAPRMPAMGDRYGNGRISRGRKSDSTAKGFTALCWCWRYIFEMIEKTQLVMNSRQEAKSMIVYRTLQMQCRKPKVGYPVRFSMVTNYAHETTAAATWTCSLLSKYARDVHPRHSTAAVPAKNT